MTLFFLALAGFLSWIISTVSGGGGALLLTPAVGYLVGARAVAPVVTLTSLLGEPTRIYLFWKDKDIDWRVVCWYLPGATVGALFGAWVFATARAEWLQVVVALFLISTVWQYRFGERERSCPMRAWAFLPVGFVVAFFSGLIGATGPVLNPFYLNYGAIKERMIATKGVNSLAMHLVKIGTYTALDSLTGEYLLYGTAAGIAAAGANWVGKRWLERFSNRRFRQLAIAVMVASGATMLWTQRDTLREVWENSTGWGTMRGRRAGS
ncbi:sulfite exporter TauE/SafE family protein [Tautonia sociabilis]|uniref:Probable membrane transporter protein n=1 Tax=Tautonia sociabilis TaxID=2080755 RepID=A0A432MCZ5_9BACT|nr:sulfite exporter TauE/SafE family protein [Tautonia sociabilis]RUL82532.1 sulfite exporter TauE/SafE family protein [Tautonia sociabilis]